ncbi:MAG: M23 family metallopeptidase [Gammaproteobacteria bacterium]|nr:M23 family metallopeptidase [Pseudomonadales bacterium]MCP5347064.1 M23 family metallopeptidase [Pseudomonadales bacterium]
MSLFESFRSLLLRYYPRQHLIAAGFLSLLLIFLLAVSNNDSSHPLQQRSNTVSALTLTDLAASPATTATQRNPATTPLRTDTPAAARIADLQDNPVPVYPAENQDNHGEIIREQGATELPAPTGGQSADQGWTQIEVQPGDNLSTIFSRVGLSDRELFHVVNSHEEAKVLNRIYPGYKLSFLIPKPGQLEKLQVLKSPMEGYLFTQVDGFYEVETIIREPEVRQVFKHGTITDSLFMAGQREQIPTLTIMEMAEIFGGVVDFILDPRIGDNFSILFEEHYLDGEFVGTGNILAAQFTNQGDQYTAVQYQDEDGEIGYYNPAGESMRKAFLRTPLDVFRISSNFSLARRHPVLNTIRAHKGTDYAAPRGTPVRATSDGRVTWASRNGTFGNLVVIKHDGGFETKYAHLNGFANGVKKGERVRQGDVIGYVGMTGSATGPHLHYEFLVNGVHQDPRTVLDKLPKAVSVPIEERDRFQQQVAPMLDRFRRMEQTRLLAQQQLGAE